MLEAYCNDLPIHTSTLVRLRELNFEAYSYRRQGPQSSGTHRQTQRNTKYLDPRSRIPITFRQLFVASLKFASRAGFAVFSSRWPPDASVGFYCP
jgi:hypothetical protein